MFLINLVFGFALGVFLNSQGMGINTYQYWVIAVLAVLAFSPWNGLAK